MKHPLSVKPRHFWGMALKLQSVYAAWAGRSVFPLRLYKSIPPKVSFRKTGNERLKGQGRKGVWGAHTMNTSEIKIVQTQAVYNRLLRDTKAGWRNSPFCRSRGCVLGGELSQTIHCLGAVIPLPMPKPGFCTMPSRGGPLIHHSAYHGALQVTEDSYPCGSLSWQLESSSLPHPGRPCLGTWWVYY